MTEVATEYPSRHEQGYAREAIQLVRGLRQSALSEHPQSEQIEQFNSTLQGTSLSVLERYFNLYAVETPPFSVVGEPVTLFLSDLSPDKSVELSVGGEYSIKASDKGRIELRAPYRGGDDLLLPGIDNDLHWLSIDVKTGDFSQKVVPEARMRLHSILKLTEAYYAALDHAVPAAQEYFKVAAYVPPGLLPQFPLEAIQQLRRAK